MLNTDDLRICQLLKAWGIPYSFGGGKPSDYKGTWPPPLVKGIKGGLGYDCSGFVQVALVYLGMLANKATDRASANLFDNSIPVKDSEARLGDMVFYGAKSIQHVMLYLNDGICFGATGGGSETNGNNPKAFVQLQPIKYRSDFRGIRRIKPNLT